MANPVQGFNSSSWQQLATQIKPGSATHNDDLPAISQGSKAWSSFKYNAEARAPYLAELNESIQTIRTLITEQATPGHERQQALLNLGQFAKSKINCNAHELSPLVINENRRNLNLFAQQLNNPEISNDKKLSAALSLAQGLGVCTEGETLNILENTQQLCNQQTGMAGLLINTKNRMIEQHLQELVKLEDAPNLSDKLAKDLEIHHIQALKNHVADQWGLCVAEDRHATLAYQNQTGDMASELLRQTITPAVLANAVTDQLIQSFYNQAGGQLASSLPTSELKTEPLRRAIQAEFGQEIDLDDCLQFNEDYTTVKLKAPQEIALHVMKIFQTMGLLHAEANPEHLLKQATPGVKHTIEKLGNLRGAPAHCPINAGLVSHFWFGHIAVPESPEKQRRERELWRTRLQS